MESASARLYLAQGNLDEAIAWAEDSGLSVDDEIRYSSTEQFPCGSELDYLTLARVLIARGSSANASRIHLDDAMRLLMRLYDFALLGQRKVRVMEVLMLQALVWFSRRDLQQALNLLDKALHIPLKGDYIRLFVDEGKPMAELLHLGASRGILPKYTSRLLAAFGQVEEKASVSVDPLSDTLIEPLRERELEVLRYLKTGLSNQDIADKLFVSLAAIKWHARNIYSKLNVSNRTQAVHRARELGILE